MITKWKVLLAAIMMVISGTMGVFLLAYVESGQWGNKSFFGCIFAGVPALWLLAKCVRVESGTLMDMAGPVCSLFLGLIKIDCLYQHCCYGMVLYYSETGKRVRFPSQILESIVGFVICALLLYLQRKPQHRGFIAQYFLIFYGSARFVLNFFRDNLKTIRFLKEYDVFLPEGHLWALICVVWGLLWLERTRIKRNRIYFSESL